MEWLKGVATFRRCVIRTTVVVLVSAFHPIAQGRADAPVQRSLLPNHFVVLFDSSGSMHTAYRASLWKGGPNLLTAKAAAIREIVRKALLEHTLRDFPRMTDEDYLSFLYFRLDWDRPSYHLEDVFITGKELLLSRGMPKAPGAFAQVETGGADGKAFSGHSPLVAATRLAIPYLGKRLGGKGAGAAQPEAVGEIILVRITDGDYNTTPSSHDESDGIRAAIAEARRKGESVTNIMGEDEYQRQARRLEDLFDLGGDVGECALRVTTRVLVCGGEANQEIREPGKGLFLHYLRAEPRPELVKPLVQIDAQRVAVDIQARDGKIWYVGNDRIYSRGKKYAEVDIAPIAEEWRMLKDDSSSKGCVRYDEEVVCHENAGEIRIKKTPEIAPLPIEIQYRFYHRLSFGGDAPLYPFAVQPDPEERQVSLELRQLKDWEKVYYPDSLAREENLGSRVREYFYPRDPETKRMPITDDVLLEAQRFFQQPSLTQREFAKESSDRHGRAEQAYAESKGIAALRRWLALSIPTIVALALWSFWPYRLLRIREEAYGSGEIIVDFNSPSQGRPELLAELVVENEARIPLLGLKPFNSGRFPLTCRVGDVVFTAQGAPLDPHTDLRFSTEDGLPPMWIGDVGKVDCVISHASDGQRVAVYFESGKVRDLLLQMEPEPCTVLTRFSIEVREAKEGAVEKRLALLFIPEAAKFAWTVMAQTQARGGKGRILCSPYRYGRRLELLTYELENRTTHTFSKPARGEWALEVTDEVGRAVKGAFILEVEGQEVGEAFRYNIQSAKALTCRVFVSFDQLENPFDTRRFVIRSRSDGKTVDEWLFDLGRSIERTDVVAEVLDQRRQLRLLCDTRHSGQVRQWMQDPDKDGRVEVHTSDSGTAGTTTLAYLHLINRCPGGHGWADWCIYLDECTLDGQRLANEAVVFHNDAGTGVTRGRLADSPDQHTREVILRAVLLHHEIEQHIRRRDMAIVVACRIDWTLRPDGDGGEPTRISHQISLDLPLRHVPPHRILAIDFGTSSIAIAHAAGSDVSTLPLRDQLQRLDEQRKAKIRAWTGREADTPFLTSDASLNSEVPEARAPDAADFMNLPPFLDDVELTPEAVFTGLKVLLPAGQELLPIPPAVYRKLRPNDTGGPPRVVDVLRGIYRGLHKDYVVPIIRRQQRDYAYVVATYPNTYARNHVQTMAEIVRDVYIGGVAPNERVYAENIQLLSESDAVAYYYLAHAWSLHGRDWQPPEQETILIYDIGAGTLDLTLLTVRREQAGDVVSPSAIEILHRAGVGMAGNRLDECIARDLDGWLAERLPDFYVNRIVGPDRGGRQGEGDFNRTRYLQVMLKLQEQIQSMKKALSRGEDPKVMIASDTHYGDARGLLSTSDDAMRRYRQVDGLTAEGDVIWRPGKKTVLDGLYVTAFLEQVTRQEIGRFLNDATLPTIDTVILSGRTALWPGLEERLRDVLNAPHWIDLKGIPGLLKGVVAEGAVISQTYFRNKIDITFRGTGLFGEYGVRYEHGGIDDWRFVAIANGERKTLHLDNANICKVVLKTRNGFIVSFSFAKQTFCPGSNSELDLTLRWDDMGLLQAVVNTPDGRQSLLRGRVDAAGVTGDAIFRPWPMTGVPLNTIQPEKLFE